MRPSPASDDIPDLYWISSAPLLSIIILHLVRDFYIIPPEYLQHYFSFSISDFSHPSDKKLGAEYVATILPNNEDPGTDSATTETDVLFEDDEHKILRKRTRGHTTPITRIVQKSLRVPRIESRIYSQFVLSRYFIAMLIQLFLFYQTHRAGIVIVRLLAVKTIDKSLGVAVLILPLAACGMSTILFMHGVQTAGACRLNKNSNGRVMFFNAAFLVLLILGLSLLVPLATVLTA